MDVDDWIATHYAARIACISAAARRGLAMLHRPEQTHLHLPQKYGGRTPLARVHRSRPIVPAGAGPLESAVDMLAHVAQCLPRLEALIVWESAIQHGLATAAALRRVRWPRRAAREVAFSASSRSESLLETIAFHRLSDAGIPVRQQVPLLGHRVDLLVGRSTVVQLDGYAFHSGPAERRRDMEHDGRLELDGFAALRFDYRAVVHAWPRTLERIGMAFAQRGA